MWIKSMDRRFNMESSGLQLTVGWAKLKLLSISQSLVIANLSVFFSRKKIQDLTMPSLFYVSLLGGRINLAATKVSAILWPRLADQLSFILIVSLSIKLHGYKLCSFLSFEGNYYIVLLNWESYIECSRETNNAYDWEFIRKL